MATGCILNRTGGPKWRSWLTAKIVKQAKESVKRETTIPSEATAMKHSHIRSKLLRWTMALGLLVCVPAHAEVIFQSATLGPTGLSWGNGWEIAGGEDLAVRFQLLNTYDVTAVGGNFVSSGPVPNGTIFAAIVAIGGPTAFPGTPGSFTPLASATLTAPSSSADIRVALPVTLGPGWYALVFGGGRFGATGNALAPGSDHDLSGVSYFVGAGVSDPGSHWANGEISDTRFVVEGTLSEGTVPEPGTGVLWVSGGLWLAWLKRRNRVALRS